MKRLLAALAALALVAGCHDDERIVAPDLPPAAPRGLMSVTGDGAVYLSWYSNTESDVVGYRIYEGPCLDGPGCPYDLVGTTSHNYFTVTGLQDGVTRYFAIKAVDRAGNVSGFSFEDVHDTPRPEGFDLPLTNYVDGPTTAGFDFSAFAIRPWNDLQTDVYFSSNGGAMRMIAPFTDTDLQDAGYASTLDAVDVAPAAGWSPSGAVELIAGHCYVVRIMPSGGLPNYGKFRVTSVSTASVVIDWAYQTALNNPELRMTPSRDAAAPRVRRQAS
jgi:hypothetical protein